MYVRINRPYDGKPDGGLPKGPVLRVTGYDFLPGGIVYLFQDGSRKMPWEVTPVPTPVPKKGKEL